MDPVTGRSIQPAGPPNAYKTYELRSPLATHHRPATCEEVGCLQWARGWLTTVPAGSGDEQLVRRMASGEMDNRRRYFTETRDGGMISFRFEAGTSCFRVGTHTTNLGRPPIMIVRDGDFRASTGNSRVHSREDDWVDDFATHQQQLADEIERG